jgi:LuxR family maltose regulon positive regulatory protein
MSALAEGLRSRRRVPGLSPWPLIHHLMVSAAVSAQAGDGDLAEELLAEVEELAPWTDESMRPTRSRIAAVRQRLTRRPVVTARPGAALTPRERQILHRLRGTQTLREIAADLFVSHNTVKTLTLSLYRKLGVHSRAEVLALADSPPRP